MEEALRALVQILREKIIYNDTGRWVDGEYVGPAGDADRHPWVPGAQFADGRIEAALRDAEAALEAPQ